VKTKIVLTILLAIVVLFIFAFGVKSCNLWWKEYFGVKEQNIEREIFEETKSYNHALRMDLAKYYDEYTTGDAERKMGIKTVVKTRFAEFDAEQLNKTPKLKKFLIKMRGY